MVCLAEENTPAAGDTVFDPTNPLRHTDLREGIEPIDLRTKVMEGGQRTRPAESLATMSERCRQQMRLLPAGTLRFVNPHRYKVSISERLKDLRGEMMQAAHIGRRQL